MNRMNHLEQVNWIAQLADLKHTHYHNSLLLSALIELLVEKEIMTAQDIAIMSAQLDASFTPHLLGAMSSPQSNDASLSSESLDAMRAQRSVDASLSSQQHSVDASTPDLIDVMHSTQSADAALSSQPIHTIPAHPIDASLNSHPGDPMQ